MNINPSVILEELVGVLEACGVKVRREPLGDSDGGLCRIGDRLVLFLDACADPQSLASLCARVLRETADIESIYLRPDVREFVEAAGSQCGQSGVQEGLLPGDFQQ